MFLWKKKREIEKSRTVYVVVSQVYAQFNNSQTGKIHRMQEEFAFLYSADYE